MREMQNDQPAWYCVRTKPKHEHIAAGNVRKRLALQVFHQQLRVQRHTQRGISRVTEPLFPCYIFVRCVLAENLDAIRCAYGVHTVVHFGDLVPVIADSTIEACVPALTGRRRLEPDFFMCGLELRPELFQILEGQGRAFWVSRPSALADDETNVILWRRIDLPSHELGRLKRRG